MNWKKEIEHEGYEIVDYAVWTWDLKKKSYFICCHHINGGWKMRNDYPIVPNDWEVRHFIYRRKLNFDITWPKHLPTGTRLVPKITGHHCWKWEIQIPRLEKNYPEWIPLDKYNACVRPEDRIFLPSGIMKEDCDFMPTLVKEES
jgi:hypothetical protein